MPTKTELPPLFRRHIRRPRLTRILDASSAQTILLLAPAGYGKTTLAAEWLQANEEAMWYRATPASADVAAFSAGVADVLQPLIPGAGERLKQRLRIGDAPEHAAQALAELLAEDLAAWPENAWLVVDDYHLVMESRATEEFMEALLNVSQIRALIVTRTRPPWATTRKRLYGELLELGPEALRMTTTEGNVLLRSHARNRATERLIAAAEGWPLILGLATISSSEAPPPNRLTDQLFDYFADEILASQRAEMADFLLRISILPGIDRDLAAAVNPISVDLLDQMLNEASAQGLLRREGTRYSMHPLLREFFQSEFRTVYGDLAGEIVDRAAFQLMRCALLDDAIAVSSTFARHKTSFEIANEGCDRLLETGRLETLDRWLTLCGAQAAQPCRLALARAEMLIRKGHAHEAEASSLAIAERADQALASTAWCRAGQAAYWSSSYERAREFFERARTCAQVRTERLDATWGAFLTAHSSAALDEDAYFAAFTEAAGSPTEIETRLRLMIGKQMASARTSWGSIWHEWQSCLALLPYAPPASRAAALVHLAWLKCMNAEFPSGRKYAVEALKLSEELGLGFGVAHSLYAMAQAEIGLRQFGRSRYSLRRFAALSADDSDPWIDSCGLLLRIRNELNGGDPHAALMMVETELHRIEEPQAMENALGLAALAAAAAGEPFTGFAQRARQEAPRTHIHVAGMLRFAGVLGGRAARRPERLTNAVIASIAEGSLDSFVLAYRAKPKLLADVRPDSIARKAIERVLAQASDRELAYRHLPFPFPAGSEEGPGLTRREREVFQLLGSGYSNQAIADALVISPSTAKVHVHNIMKKLGTRSRFEARLIWEGEPASDGNA